MENTVGDADLNRCIMLNKTITNINGRHVNIDVDPYEDVGVFVERDMDASWP